MITKIFTILIIVLFLVALTQVIRIFQLTGKIKGYDINAITDSDNNLNGILSIVFSILFFAFCVYQYLEFKKFILPESASFHGIFIDKMNNLSLIAITVVFVIMNALIFYLSYKYRSKKETKASFVTHNNKLELIWTILPGIVLTVYILYGLNVWSQVMHPSEEDPMLIEIYGQQFSWTARYAGEDNLLGESHYTLVNNKNVLGVDSKDVNSNDDIIVRELHIPIDEPIMLKFRSQDALHSAYLPHFRVQMNCVPGLETSFMFIPIKTTKQMRIELKDESFDYVLLCNKICGSSHFNMQMKVIVETREEYNEWIGQQPKFKEINL